MININYEQAHKVVDSNKNLMWIGWDIIEYRYDNDAMYEKNSMRINGRWAKIKTYSLDNAGWKVPDKYALR